MMLDKKIASCEAVVGVIGLGYIGLTLLEAFSQAGFPLVGYDRNASKVEMLKKKKSYINFMPLKQLFSGQFEASSDPSILKKADIIIISVSTSLDNHRLPNLSNLREAFQTVAACLKKGMLIILQSTTYPGTTEEELVPLLEKSGLKVGRDFFIDYVPEISDPGNPNFTYTQLPHVIGGVTPACVQMAELLYTQLGCKVFRAPSTRVAEAAKILQNAYRLINISFINEMKIMFDRMGIDIWEVIKAAATKPFGFVPFYPSPGIGGDCISVVPLYLVWKSRESDGPSSMLELADSINTMIPHYVVDKVVLGLGQHKKGVKGSRILLLGVGYKKDVNDIRESASLKVLELLKHTGADIQYHDPYIPQLSQLDKYPDLTMKSVELDYDRLDAYDAVVIATDHSMYDWAKIVAQSKLIIDTRNVTSGIKCSKGKVIQA